MLCNIILNRDFIPFQILVKKYGIYFYINHWNPHLLQGLDLGISSEQPSYSVGSVQEHTVLQWAPTLIHGVFICECSDLFWWVFRGLCCSFAWLYLHSSCLISRCWRWSSRFLMPPSMALCLIHVWWRSLEIIVCSVCSYPSILVCVLHYSFVALVCSACITAVSHHDTTSLAITFGRWKLNLLGDWAEGFRFNAQCGQHIFL